MKVNNLTDWRTDQIKALVQKVAEAELEPKARKSLVVTVKYRRTGYRGVLGRAHLGTRLRPARNLDLYLRRPQTLEALEMPKGDVVMLAHTIAHEMAHLKGMTHREMRGFKRYDYSEGWAEYYAWAEAFEIRVRPAKAKPTASDIVGRKLEHAAAMLAKAKTRARRASTIEKKWRTKLRYYEKKMAAVRAVDGGK